MLVASTATFYHVLGNVILVLLVVSILTAAVAFCIWLPHARVGRLGSTLWQVPSSTFLMPRFLVKLVGAIMYSAVVVHVVLAIVVHWIFAAFAILAALQAIPYHVSAGKRLARHPSSEYVMRSPFPYPLRKRM